MKRARLFTAGLLLILMNLFVTENKPHNHPSTQPISADSSTTIQFSPPNHVENTQSSPRIEILEPISFQFISDPIPLKESIIVDEPNIVQTEPEPLQLAAPIEEQPLVQEDATPLQQPVELLQLADCSFNDTPPCPPQEINDPPCESIDPCVNCAQLWPSCGPDWIITPNAGPCVRNGTGFFVTGEFIYWTVRQDHLAFAYSTPAIVDPFVVPQGKGSVFHPDWKFEPGFKIGLGILFNHDGWDLYANFTWINICHFHNSTSLKPGFILRDFEWGRTTQSQNDNDAIQNIHGKWSLHSFNVVDIELGRNFYLSSCLQMRPHFGLKGTWQEQKFFVTHNSLNVLNSEESINFSNHRMCYWGVGLRTGLDSSWHFSNCFSLFGEVAIAALWERFEVQAKVVEENLSLGTTSGFLHVENTFHTLKPVLELYMGLRFETWFCCDGFHVSLEAGFEEQWWSNQNQFFSFSSESRLGDLVLQGLTIKLRLDF